METALNVRRSYIKNKLEVDNEVLEGEVPMTQEQQDYYKQVIGDGQGRISVGRDMSEMAFGSGGKVFVSVSLACDQSSAGIMNAIGLAASMADYYIALHHQQMKERCVQMGLLKPAPISGMPQY